MKHAHLIFTTRAQLTSCDTCGQVLDVNTWQQRHAHWRGWADSVHVQRDERRARIEAAW